MEALENGRSAWTSCLSVSFPSDWNRSAAPGIRSARAVPFPILQSLSDTLHGHNASLPLFILEPSGCHELLV